MGGCLITYNYPSGGSADLMPNYTTSTALYIDTKIDDGLAMSGNVRCNYFWGSASGIWGPPLTNLCFVDLPSGIITSNSGNNYNTSLTGITTGIVFGNQF